MGGAPMTALHQGAIQIGTTILSVEPEEHRPFQKLITMPYDANVNGEFTATDLKSYEDKIKTIKASGGTNFKAVFQRIMEFHKTNKELRELVVIFFTDGEDTKNAKLELDKSLELLTAILKSDTNVSSRFLSIGFSRNHDAGFMNRIAQAGSEMGNFFYIDTSKGDYKQDVTNALSESLNIAMEGGSLKMEIKNEMWEFSESGNTEFNYIYKEAEESKED
jgi:hypothetical protein